MSDRSWWVSLVQRFVLGPLIVGLTIALWTTLPLWLVGAAVISPFVPGWARPVRLLWVGVVHLTLESLMLIELLGLWIASGLGLALRTPYFQRIHYDIAQTYLEIFVGESRRVLRLQIETVGPSPDAFPGSPLLVLSRHAGVGDSFTLMYVLMHWYHREPRIVLKDSLKWDPAVGVLLSRVPSRFVSPRRTRDLEREVGELARHLDHNDAFVIFPEGGNFTPRRRERAIARLRRSGLTSMARRAERMRNVLAPRPGGVLAALDAAPGVDVLLVAHTGLDHVLSVRDAWRELPMDKRLLMGWWRVPRAEIPEDREARIDWLFTRWEEIDRWVEEHRPVELPRSRRRERQAAR